MKKTLFLSTILLALAWSGDAGAQLVTYDFEGDVATPSFVDGEVSASDFSRNAVAFGFSTGSPGDAISGNGWNASDRYWEFTVTANPGIALDLSSLSFDYRRSSTGPSGYEVTINGLNVSSGSMTATLTGNTFYPATVPISGFSTLSSAQVRIYGTGATGPSGTFRLDNVVLDGLALRTVPEPSTWLLLAGGSVFLASRLRRRK